MKLSIYLFLLISNISFSPFNQKDVESFFKYIEKEKNISSFFERDKYEEFKTAIIYIENKKQKLVAFEEIKKDSKKFHQIKYNKNDFEFAKQTINYDNILTFSSGGMIEGIDYQYYIVLKKNIN